MCVALAGFTKSISGTSGAKVCTLNVAGFGVISELRKARKHPARVSNETRRTFEYLDVNPTIKAHAILFFFSFAGCVALFFEHLLGAKFEYEESHVIFESQSWVAIRIRALFEHRVPAAYIRGCALRQKAKKRLGRHDVVASKQVLTVVHLAQHRAAEGRAVHRELAAQDLE